MTFVRLCGPESRATKPNVRPHKKKGEVNMTIEELKQHQSRSSFPVWMPKLKVRLKIGGIFNRCSQEKSSLAFMAFYARLIRVYGQDHALELKRMWQRGEL